ncbi:MAG: LicD family protein [Clostridia bacterium]|nr:LicD family protein [Clostridia bacterium]
MTPLQFRMLELVLEIDEICKKHNITYYLTGGSVLGAVRHKGFIPWDDDVDIMMTRDAFNQFCEVCKTEMRDDREIITMINTPCHTKITIKYMNKNTSQFFRSQVLDYTGCGISLDIMILDPLPADPEAKEQHIAEWVVYNELLTPFFMVNERLWKYVDLYRHYEAEIKRVGKEKVMADLYHRLFEAEPAESNQYLYRWGQQLLIYDRDLMGTPRYMDFCGYSLPCPEKTVDFLRATYGDNWIYLPDEQNRETHTSNMDPNIAYVNWLRDIRPAINSEKALADFVARKAWNVQKAIPAHEVQVNGYLQTALLTEMEFEADPRLSYEALAQLSAPEVLTRVDSYLRTQISGPYLKNDIFVHLPDNTIALILRALLRQGEFARAGKLIAARQKQGELTAELQAAQECFVTIRSLVRYFEDRYVDVNDVEPLSDMAPRLEAALTAYPDHLNLLRCRLQYILLSDATADHEAAARHAIATFPTDTEIAYWAGAVLERCGYTDEAAALYKQASATSNGVILMYLSEKNQGGTDHE